MRNKVLPGLAKHIKPITIEHAELGNGINAEAISEDKIVINKDIPKDSELYKRAIAHETHHVKEMKNGRIADGKDWVREGDQVFQRQNGNIQGGRGWRLGGSDSVPLDRHARKAGEAG